jgi:hypothetical protein
MAIDVTISKHHSVVAKRVAIVVVVIIHLGVMKFVDVISFYFQITSEKRPSSAKWTRQVHTGMLLHKRTSMKKMEKRSRTWSQSKKDKVIMIKKDVADNRNYSESHSRKTEA